MVLSASTPASSTSKTGRHDIAEILLKVAFKHKKIKINNLNRQCIFNNYYHNENLTLLRKRYTMDKQSPANKKKMLLLCVLILRRDNSSLAANVVLLM